MTHVETRVGFSHMSFYGMIAATALSYMKFGSAGWAILSGIASWFYVIYYFIVY